MKNRVLLLIIIGVCGSCKNVVEHTDHSEAIHAIHIDPQESKYLNWNEKIKILKIVPLETTEASLVQRIEKIYITHSGIVVYDNKQEEVFIFDSIGNYRAKCGKRGMGPGEHIRFNDVFFEKSTRLIYAHEAVRRSMQIFDMEGNLVKEFPTHNFWFQSFYKLQNNYWLYTGDKELNPEGYSLLQVDEEIGEMINGYFPQKFFLPATFHSAFFENEKGECFYSSPHSNSVFRLNNQEFDPTPFFQIDFGNQTVTDKLMSEMADEDMYRNLLYNKEYMGNTSNFILFENNLFFSYSQLSQHSVDYFAWYETTQKKAYSYRGFSANKGQFLLQNPIGVHAQGLIFEIWPGLLNEEEIYHLETISGHSFSLESNPVLVYATLHI